MALTSLHKIKLNQAIYMCNYGCSIVKPLSQKSLATYSLSYQKLLYESKDIQIASMKCGSLKSGIGDSKLLTRVFIPWFG